MIGFRTKTGPVYVNPSHVLSCMNNAQAVGTSVLIMAGGVAVVLDGVTATEAAESIASALHVTIPPMPDPSPTPKLVRA